MVRGVVVAPVNNDGLLSGGKGGSPFLTAVLLVRITDGCGDYHRLIRHSVMLRRINKLFVEEDSAGSVGADTRGRATLVDPVESVDLSGGFKQFC